MANKSNSIIIASVLVVLYSIHLLVNYFSSTESIKSTLDNKYYTVKKGKNSQKAADLLATINKNTLTLIQNLKTDPKFQKNTINLQRRYNKDSLVENLDPQSTSFSINKGQTVSMCLASRNPENSELYDINLLMFVAIHELAHIGCDEIGHGTEFRSFFKFLLQEAMRVGVYKYENYTKKPVNYCGLEITGSPLS
jgi:hypothetical protein